MVKRSAFSLAAALIFSLVTLPGSVAEGESAAAAPPSAAGAGLSGAAGTATRAAAQPRSLPPEAPSSLFAVEFGGSDVEFLVRGSWELKLLSQGSLESSAASGLRLAEFQPLLFSQRPDLFLSFLLFDRLFVEARVSDDLSQARYAAGYRGAEGESLREIRIGNDGISFPTMPFLSFGQGSRRSFGLAASAGSETFDGRAMLRYDQADRVEKRFVGSAEVAETLLQINQFLRGRWFVTLDVPPATNLLVYVESAAGTLSGSDGRKYRQLDQGEYSYSSSTGVVSLSRAATTRVAASYAELSAPHFAFSIDGRNVSLLFDPLVRYDSANSETKTELLNRYAIVETGGADAFVRDRASGLRDESFEVRLDPSGYLELSRGGIVDPRDIAGRFSRPFEARVSELYSRDYGEDGSKDYLPYLPLEIVIRRARAVSEISVDKDLVAGSVEVLRNGVPDYAFTVDADAGVLKLATPPGLQEEISVSYLRESSERRAGSLAAGIGGTLSLGPERSVWTALGLRWSLPGQSFAAGGVSNPGSVVLTAGERDGEGAFRHRAALAGTWTTEEASGRYRIEGMESSGSFGSSFAPTTTLPTGASVVEIQESALRARFPTYMDATHRDGTVQQALRLAAGTGGSINLAKIEAAVPLAKLKTFSFFARSSNPASVTTLTIALDEGKASTEALAVTIPAAQLTTTWRRYTFAYASADGVLRYLDAEGGASGIVASSTPIFDLSRAGATRLRIDATGLAAGEELWIDEIVLEESAGRAALLLDGQLSYADPSLRLGPEGFPLLRGLELKVDTAAGLQTGSYLTGGLSLGAGLGPLDLVARLRGSLAEGAAAGSGVEGRLRGGHELGLPLGPATLRDRFDFDPSTGSFGRENALSLRAGAVAGLEARETSVFSAAAAASLPGDLAQTWSARLDLGGGLFAAELKAANKARPTGSLLAAGSYFPAWIEAFSSILPSAEDSSTRREASLSLAASLKSARQFALATAQGVGEPTAAGGAIRRDEARLRLALPLSLPGKVGLTPFYERRWKEKRLGAGAGLFDFSGLVLGDLAAASPLWTGIPFHELVEPGAPAAFAAATGSGLGGAAEASYAPETGLLLTREFGSSWLDLLLPASLSLAYKRELARAGDVVTSTGAWELGAKGAALNLFGVYGAYPVVDFFEEDEYVSTTQVKFARVEGDSFIRLKLLRQDLLTFYAKEGRNSLILENRVAAERDPSLATWSESLRLALSMTRERHWLLDLYRLVLPPVPAVSAEAPKAGEPASKIVSGYLADLSGRRPRARTLLNLKTELSGRRSDAGAPQPTLAFEESVEGRLTLPDRLTVSTVAALSQRRDGTTATLLLGFTLSLSLTLSF